MTRALLAGIFAAAFGLGNGAHATPVPVFDSFAPFAEPTFGGSGINTPSLNIATSTITDGANTITLGLAATRRFSGNPPVTDDGAGTYFAQGGFNTPAGSSIPGTLWNFNFFVDISGGGTLTDYDFSLEYDFGTAAVPVAADLGTLSGAAMAVISGAGDPFTGIFPRATRMESSQNLAFNFLSVSVPGGIDAPTTVFDPNAGGLYSFTLSASEISGATLGTTAINVSVAPVPLPASMALLLAGLGGLLLYGRRQGHA